MGGALVARALGITFNNLFKFYNKELKMKKNQLSFVIIILIVILIGCSGSKKYFEYAQNENSVVAWERFIDKYPDSEFIEEAKERLQQLIIEKEKKDSLAWVKAKTDNTTDSYLVYIDGFPKGNYLVQADSLFSIVYKNKINEIIAADRTKIKSGELFPLQSFSLAELSEALGPCKISSFKSFDDNKSIVSQYFHMTSLMSANIAESSKLVLIRKERKSEEFVLHVRTTKNSEKTSSDIIKLTGEGFAIVNTEGIRTVYEFQK